MADAVASSPSLPLPSDLSEVDDHVPAHHANAVLAFIIGLSIVTLASVLNAAGLNLTKLDHVRTMAIPKANRRRDWLRPLWLLGMLLYILSQLIGSTLALEYLRAEYVAPLGSTSLIFNFLFARFLVSTPVTWNDIYGTVIVILGVIGIVAFGSINSGLSTETDAAHLTHLWTRGGWLSYFFFMSFALIFLYIFTATLDAVLVARQDLSAAPFAGMTQRQRAPPAGSSWLARAAASWTWAHAWVAEHLELWTAAKPDKHIAWTLGIGWACCGGGLAGGTLVFAKASVQLISDSLSHENPGNQLGHASSIFTLVLTAVTAVMQIICLNRGLKVYDSTLVVPVFYGVYTAAGFLNALIFNDSVDAYQNWTLFLIFVSILILVSGVVLLTHKKPEVGSAAQPGTKLGAISPRKTKGGKAAAKKLRGDDDDADEGHALRAAEEGAEDSAVMWQVGDVSDDEDEEDRSKHASAATPSTSSSRSSGVGEGAHLMAAEHEDDDDEHHPSAQHRRVDSDETLARRSEDADEFGAWKGANTAQRRP